MQKNNLYAAGKVIMEVYYVVLGGEICLVLVLDNLLKIDILDLFPIFSLLHL
jgi:hypothetical protein